MMPSPGKPGKWSVGEDQTIIEGIANGDDVVVIQQKLRDKDTKNRARDLKTLKKRINILKAKTEAQNEKDDQDALKQTLHSREYWDGLREQFTQAELEYFEIN